MRIVVVAWASSLPLASATILPSAVAIREPRCTTSPLASTGPVSTVMGLVKFVLTSSDV